MEGLRNKRWLKWENQSSPCSPERVAELAGQLGKLQVEVEVEALGGERRQKGRTKGSVQVTEQEHRSFRRREKGKKRWQRVVGSEKC